MSNDKKSLCLVIHLVLMYFSLLFIVYNPTLNKVFYSYVLMLPCFVDFTNTFDYVNRDDLHYKLKIKRQGIKC